MASASEKALFCFEFFVETIVRVPNSASVQTLEIKFNDYEWLTISQEHWDNVGKRCYLINEANFLEQMLTSKLRIRALCSNRSAYSCDVSLASFYVSDDAVSCKGLMELYSLDNNKSSENLYMRVAMRVFNVDRVHPASIFRRNILAVDRNTQTERCSMEREVQTGATTLRHAAVQTKHRKAKSKQTQVMERRASTTDVAVQLSSRISRNELNRGVAEVIAQTLTAAKRKKNLQRKPKKSDPERVDDDTDIIRPKTGYASGVSKKTGGTLSKHVPEGRSYLGRSYKDTTVNHRIIGYNAVCRKQLLRTLDRLIAQKTANLQQIRPSMFANHLDKNRPQWKVERLCRTVEGIKPGGNEPILKRHVILRPMAKTSTNRIQINGERGLSQSVQDLFREMKSKTNYISGIDGTNPASSETGMNEQASASTSGNSSSRKFKRDSIINRQRVHANEPNGNDSTRNNDNHSDGSDNDDDDSDNSHDSDNNNSRDNDRNGNNNYSTARTISTECSSDALTVSEQLESIK